MLGWGLYLNILWSVIPLFWVTTLFLEIPQKPPEIPEKDQNVDAHNSRLSHEISELEDVICKFAYLHCFMSIEGGGGITLPKITKCDDIKRKENRHMDPDFLEILDP